MILRGTAASGIDVPMRTTTSDSRASGGAETLSGAFAVVDAGRGGSLTDSFQGLVENWPTDETGGDKQVPVIFFGTGMQGRSAYNAALRAGTLGWKAYWYRGGIEAWQANGLPMAGQSE